MDALGTNEAEDIVRFARDTIRDSGARRLAALDAHPMPIYATDTEGLITYYNQACVRFAGREPTTGVDRWCVSWKLFTLDGAELPHDRCPMAVAIRQQRPVRGLEAIAERPDGSQVHFIPFPTPVHDEAGALVGAVNLILEATEAGRAGQLRTQAERCRRLARGIDDRQTRDRLLFMADDYEERANAFICN